MNSDNFCCTDHTSEYASASSSVSQLGIIECKAFNNRATSMKFVLANPKRFGVHSAVKIADTNVGTTNDYDTLPLYSLGFIQQEKKLTLWKWLT